MTPIQNDAAVNAESDDRARQARHLADLLDMDMDRERSANLIPKKLAQVKDRYDGHIDPEIRIRKAADQLRDYANLIERHATPKTQATHGEGEAFAYLGVGCPNCGRDRLFGIAEEGWTCEKCSTRFRLIDVGNGDSIDVPRWLAIAARGALRECDEKSKPARTWVEYFEAMNKLLEPAPSPTAAPALGELAKALQARIAVRRNAEKFYDEGDTLLMEKAAAALSGVAAQGDGEARVSEDAEFQLYFDDEPVAVASGPRKDALREIHHYALQYNQDGAVRIEEVIRKPLSAIENVMSLGVADQGPNIDLPRQG